MKYCILLGVDFSPLWPWATVEPGDPWMSPCAAWLLVWDPPFPPAALRAVKASQLNDSIGERCTELDKGLRVRSKQSFGRINETCSDSNSSKATL